MDTFRCQVFPSIIRGYRSSDPSMSVTSFRSFSVCCRHTRRQKSRSWPCSRIALEFVNSSHSITTPAYRLTASYVLTLRSSFPPSRVPLSLRLTHLLPRFFTESQLFSFLLRGVLPIHFFISVLSFLCVSVSLPFLIFFVTDLTSRIFHGPFFFLARLARHRFFFRSTRKKSRRS